MLGALPPAQPCAVIRIPFGKGERVRWGGGSKSDLIIMKQLAWPQQLGGFNLIWRGEAAQRLPLARALAAHDGLRAAPGAGCPGVWQRRGETPAACPGVVGPGDGRGVGIPAFSLLGSAVFSCLIRRWWDPGKKVVWLEGTHLVSQGGWRAVGWSEAAAWCGGD